MVPVLKLFRHVLQHLFLTAALTSFVLFLQVYAVYFKSNRQLIREFENLRNYTAEIYQMPGKREHHSSRQSSATAALHMSSHSHVCTAA